MCNYSWDSGDYARKEQIVNEKINLEYDVSKMAELEALGIPSFHEYKIQQQYMNNFIWWEIQKIINSFLYPGWLQNLLLLKIIGKFEISPHHNPYSQHSAISS